MKKFTDFRAWVHQLWVENCEDHFVHAEPRLGEQEYFQKYKYWLKREFRHHCRREQQKILDKLTLDQKIANCYNHKSNKNLQSH